MCFPASLINKENLTMAFLQSLFNLIKFKFLRRFHTILKDRVPRTPLIFKLSLLKSYHTPILPGVRQGRRNLITLGMLERSPLNITNTSMEMHF